MSDSLKAKFWGISLMEYMIISSFSSDYCKVEPTKSSEDWLNVEHRKIHLGVYHSASDCFCWAVAWEEDEVGNLQLHQS